MALSMDDIEFICPCCHSNLGIDDVGDLYLIQQAPLEPGHNRGIGGLTVIDANPEWRTANYNFNQQERQTDLIEFGFPSLNAPDKDPAVEAAAERDLINKGLK